MLVEDTAAKLRDWQKPSEASPALVAQSGDNLLEYEAVIARCIEVYQPG